MAEIRIRDQGKITVQDADSSNEVSLQAPSTVASNTEFTLPSTSGSANNIITTNASGVLSMTDINTLVTSDIAWQSTVKTGDFTAVAGEGYFVDTSSGAVTVTLPNPPSAGDTVAIKDYAETFATNNVTINRNGHNIQGQPNDSILKTNRASVVLVYNSDAVSGWLYTVENNVGDLRPPYVSATGGTITTSGDFKIHTFTGDGTFTVTNAGDASGSNTVDYLVVAGGGGSGGGGGGAGGYRESFPNPATGGLSVSAQAYPIQVGAGGTAGAPNAGSNAAGDGGNSIFSTITSTGGGKGGKEISNGSNGGSGGGASGPGTSGGSGNTPPVSPSQGNNGGTGTSPTPQATSGGGGGASQAGGNGSNPTGGGGAGGNGTASTITGSSVTRAGGGGGGSRYNNSPSQPPYAPVQASGGSGGGGAGGYGVTQGSPTPQATQNGSNGTANTGGGAGGASMGNSAPGGAGGDGVVIIRYKYQN